MRKRTIEIAEEGGPVPLEIDPCMVVFIIVKARAFDVKYAPPGTEDGSNDMDDNQVATLEDTPADLTEQELRDALEGLTEDAQLDLVAMFWLGRGDFTADEWEAAKAQAREREGEPVSDYLMGEPSLGDFIAEGFTALGYDPQDYGVE